jgi:hypothetical protein
MFSRRNLLAIAAMTFGLAVVATNASPAFAGPLASNNDRVRMFAFMSSGVTKARARYEERNNASRRKFNFQVEMARPGQVFTVSAAGNVVGTATVDAFGRGKFELDSSLGHSVPTLASGTLIEVRNNGTVIMSGQLR